jgi:Fur family ferric uptake transcriptional regulator
MVDARDLVAALRAAGLRVTAPRRAVCEVLADGPEDHLSAADIVERASGAGIDPSTVYRTLDTLEELGLVHHVHLGHGAGAYHVTGSARHHHLVCERCGAVVDVPLAALRSAIDAVTRPHGFVADGAHFAIVGRCASCADRGPSR